jgi:hypothetical protein
VPQGLVKADNQIVVSGDPIRLEFEVGVHATAVKMLPGRIVIFDDTDICVVESGDEADNFVGILDVRADVLEATHFAVGDQVMVITGPGGIVVKLLLLGGQNVTRGDRLVCGGDGKVKKLAVGLMGAQGSPIGIALESSNVTTDAEILVLWRPGEGPATVS